MLIIRKSIIEKINFLTTSIDRPFNEIKILVVIKVGIENEINFNKEWKNH